MAAPTKTVPHPGRALAALAALIVIMLLAILGGNLFSPSQWHKDFKIGLGLDLSSGTQLSMKATTLNGSTPSTADMNEAETIILSRVNATGNTGASVQTQGNDILNVSVPGQTTEQTEKLVSETALLNFRQTLLFEPYSGTSSPPSASATPSASASASPGARSTTRRRRRLPRPAPPARPRPPPRSSRPRASSPKATSTASPKASASARAPQRDPVHERHYPRRREPGQQGDARPVQQGAVHAGRHHEVEAAGGVHQSRGLRQPERADRLVRQQRQQVRARRGQGAGPADRHRHRRAVHDQQRVGSHAEPQELRGRPLVHPDLGADSKYYRPAATTRRPTTTGWTPSRSSWTGTSSPRRRPPRPSPTARPRSPAASPRRRPRSWRTCCSTGRCR